MVSLVSRFDAGAAVVDEHGRLWVLDAATGDLIWLEGGKRGVRRGAVTDAGLLVLADDAPVLVDTAARRADLLDRTTAKVRRSMTLDVRPGEPIAVSGSPHSARLYVAAARGVLAVCELSQADCTTAIPLSPDATDLGAPVETGGRVFVPDYGTGQVWIVDLNETRVVARPQVLHPRTKFQLLTRDGLVFFNDPDSEHAGMIHLDSRFTLVAVVSSANPFVGDAVALLAAGAPGKPAPTAARWDFGDGQTGDGPRLTHHWGAPRNYLVSVQATFPGNATATTSITIVVATRPITRPVLTVLTPANGVIAGPGFGAPRSRLTVTPPANGRIAGPNGINCPGTCTATYTAGQPITLMMTTDRTASVRFDTRKTLVISSSQFEPGGGAGVQGPGGLFCQDHCTWTFDPGQQITLTAVDQGLTFLGWGGDCASRGTNQTCTLTMNRNRSVTAAFDITN